MYPWDRWIYGSVGLGSIGRHFDLLIPPLFNPGELEQLAEGLNREEERQMKRMIQRINTLVEYAEDRNVRVMVDAEQVFLAIHF